MYTSAVLQKVDNLGYQSNYSIDRLLENIGHEEGKELLAESLPIIMTRRNAILRALKRGDINVACEYAHKTAGSIRLYGSSRLEALLLEVTLLSVDQTPRSNLYNELQVEFDSAIQEIQERLRIGFS